MVVEYRMTPNGTLYTVEEIKMRIPDFVETDTYDSLPPIFIEDDKFEETQDKMWAIYDTTHYRLLATKMPDGTIIKEK